MDWIGTNYGPSPQPGPLCPIEVASQRYYTQAVYCDGETPALMHIEPRRVKLHIDDLYLGHTVVGGADGLYEHGLTRVWHHIILYILSHFPVTVRCFLGDGPLHTRLICRDVVLAPGSEGEGYDTVRTLLLMVGVFA